MAFAPSKRRRKTRKIETERSLTSMMDMMTIILLFLLKSYSSSGALIKPAIDNLPESTADTEPRKELSIIVTRDMGILADVETDPKPLISPLGELNDDTEAILPGLESYILDQQQKDERLGKKKITDKMTIQGADDIPYAWILKVTQTGQEAGIVKYDFLIIKKSS